MESIMKSIMSLKKKNKIERDDKIVPIRKINPMEKNIMEHKKMQELQNKIMGRRNDIVLAKGVVPDPRKRQFIRKGILGIIAGIGIAIFSKIAHAGGINFADTTVLAGQATQSAIKAETNEDTYAPPDLLKHSPGVAKGHASNSADGTTILSSYNLASLTDNGVGDRIYVWNVDFSSVNYAIVTNVEGADVDEHFSPINVASGQTAGQTRIVIRTTGATSGDRETNIAVFGDQ